MHNAQCTMHNAQCTMHNAHARCTYLGRQAAAAHARRARRLDRQFGSVPAWLPLEPWPTDLRALGLSPLDRRPILVQLAPLPLELRRDDARLLCVLRGQLAAHKGQHAARLQQPRHHQLRHVD